MGEKGGRFVSARDDRVQGSTTTVWPSGCSRASSPREEAGLPANFEMAEFVPTDRGMKSTICRRHVARTFSRPL
jgi:hypothetical protein